MTNKNCAYCGVAFEGRQNRLYCSEKCKMAAFYTGSKPLQNDLQNYKPLNEKSVEPLTLLRDKPVEPDNSIIVHYSMEEKEHLEQLAESCGIDVSDLIRIRSLMEETNTIRMEQTINSQKDEISELKVRLSFFKNSEHSAPSTPPRSGLHVDMNEAQLEVLADVFIEKAEVSGDDDEAEELQDMRANDRNALFNAIGKDIMINTLFSIAKEIAEATGEDGGEVNKRVFARYNRLRDELKHLDAIDDEE